MQVRGTRGSLAMLFALSIAGLNLGCGNDDGPTGGDSVPAELVGTWTATSFVLDGVDLVAGGIAVSFIFNSDATYAFNVTGDAAGLYCDPGPDCSDFGDFSATSTRIVLDPGELTQVTINYTLSGDTLTFSGSFAGSTFSGVLQRVV